MDKAVKNVVLSLLISMVFILSSASVVFGDVKKAESATLNEDKWTVNSPSSSGSCLCDIGSISLNPHMPQGTYNITLTLIKCCSMTCDVKLFCDVFKLDLLPDKVIYCTDFEDPADIYNNWETIDGNGGPGGIDTFTRSNKKSHSSTHSFRCTQFGDHYMDNQLDYLEFHLDNSEGYDEINLEFWHWCEGEIIDGTPHDYGEVLFSLDYGGSWHTWGEYYYDTEGEWELIGDANEDTGALGVTGVSNIPEIWYRFKWVSDPSIQNEGWYIDDVYFYASNIPGDELVFQTHCLYAVALVDIFTKYTFPGQPWVADEDGTYLFRIWMLSETVGCDVKYPQCDPFEFEVEIGGSTTELEVDAHGGYHGLVDEKVQLSGSAYNGVEPYTWHWDLGNRMIMTKQDPKAIYDSAGNYTITLTVTDGENNEGSDTTWILIEEEVNNPPDKPTITGPASGKVWVEYSYTFVTTDPDENDVYYRIDWENEISEWKGPYASGEEITVLHNWTSEGAYNVRVKGMDNQSAESVWSGTLLVEITGVVVSYVTAVDCKYIKNGDPLEIKAGIAYGQHLATDDITADLSGVGKGTSVPADSFNGLTATWNVDDVECTPSDGPITITVTATDSASSTDSNTITITADNTPPELYVIKPENALYFREKKLFPLKRPIILGPMTLEVNADDSSGIRNIEYYIDDELKEFTDNYMNQRLLGRHTLKIIVYDNARNIKSESKPITIFNLFGTK
jgi:PKD repeat protein